MNQTEERKREHVQISLKESVSAHRNYWDDVQLIHNALPEINENEIDLSTTLFGKKLSAPLIISGMTGGYSEGKKINEHLAAAAATYQIGMGVGSQRAALENQKLVETYSIIKEYDIPLKIANIGASQMVLWDKQQILQNAGKIVEMIDADVLAVCLNFLQEAIQPEGEAQAKGCLATIDMLSREFSRPIIIKESGAGISSKIAHQLKKTKICGIDVGGAGGTSFSAVEYYRAKLKGDIRNMRAGQTFWDWGIPTPTSILEVGKAISWELPIIATGGIRDGLDIARALVLGASAAGMAHALLKPALKDTKTLEQELEIITRELRIAMFLVGADTVDKLSTVEVRYGSTE
ncbi:MAG: type 2 isopentenyl-diphosphate Delta-isomerase [Candidatus Thermoplasmatota archaeon]|jgi:isopentenyl-diphosphate delta-isomerase|nr:type 2 isopentenyl-diphosphate Delta-isomerase [Candidatus Thermoplasmatota archaeon]